MSGYAPGLLLVLFGRPLRVERNPWKCECGAEWEIAAESEPYLGVTLTKDILLRGSPCRWCVRTSDGNRSMQGRVLVDKRTNEPRMIVGVEDSVDRDPGSEIAAEH